jgi:hypothetical protein
MSIESNLEKVFNAYLNLAKAELVPQQVESNLRQFELYRNRLLELRGLVEELEARREFLERKELLLALDDRGSDTMNLPTDFPTTATWFDYSRPLRQTGFQSSMHVVSPSSE